MPRTRRRSLALGLLVAVVAGDDLGRIPHAIGAALRYTLGRVSRRIASRTDPAAIETAVAEFDDARRLIRDDPGRVVIAFGWVLLA